MQARLTRAFGISILTMLTLTLFFGLTLATLLRFSPFSEQHLSIITIVITLVITFIGGLTAAVRTGNKGWLSGLVAGGMFVFFAFLIQYLGYGQGLSTEQMMIFSGCIVSAVLGGMIGIQLFSSMR